MTSILTPRIMTPTRPEEQSSTDTKSPRRIQRSGLENRAPPSSFDLSSRPSLDARPTFPSRRTSSLARSDQKGPLGPRPLDTSTSKRVTSDAYRSSASRSFLPSSATEPFLGLSGRRSASTSHPANLQDASSLTPVPSLQPIPPLSSGPDTQRQSPDKSFARSSSTTQPAQRSTRSSLDFGNGNKAGAIRNNTSASLSASKNPAVRAAQVSTSNAEGASSLSSLSIRNRRQSHFPPSTAPIVDARAPRKSIGPGFVVTNTAERAAAQAKATPLEKLPSSGPPSRRTSNASSRTRTSTGPSVTPAATIERLARPKRDAKAQSMQPPPRMPPPPVPGLTSHKTEELPASNLIGRSPARPTLWRATTPTASSKRQSSVGGRISGLGARTVSPTDARRAKRVSTMPDPPPMPGNSITPDPPFTDALPQPPRLRSTTPGSPRATPEALKTNVGRVSSRSSYSSLRPSSSSGQLRLSSSTAKGHGQRSSEVLNTSIIPPVPKIPQAYESPSDIKSEPFFSDIMASLAAHDQNAGKETTTSSAPQIEPFAKLIHAMGTGTDGMSTKPQNNISSRPDLTKSAVTQHTRQHSSVPRLPPLNLLPLSDPTLTARMAAFAQAQHDRQPSTSKTPPPKRNNAKTPTTPMTASKATFSSQDFGYGFDFDTFQQLRSSTAYGNGRAESPSHKSASASPDTFKSFSPETPKQESTPVMPTPAAETGPTTKSGRAQSRGRTTSNTSTQERQPSRLVGRRSRAASKAGGDPSTTKPEAEAQPQGQASSLRRKLSMAWRRDSPKAPQSNKQDESLSKEAVASLQMPPPKIPASVLNGSRPGSKTLSSRATPVDPSAIAATGATRRAAAAPEKSAASVLAAPANKVSVSHSTNSFFSPMQKMLGSRTSSGAMKGQAPDTSKLDQDDLFAEQEMKKLASKRKDFEVSARELDDLTRKASPKERLSPGQAAKVSTLNIFERGEIIDYKDIFFTGARNAKKFVGDLASQASNFGFDDERGDYNIVMGDHLAYRYEVIDMLGKGSFGQVVRCIDHKNGKLVAIKIIRNKKRFHQQALVEVNILQRLREWDPQGTHSMISFTQSFYFRGHLCISTELLGMNLYEFIKAHDFRGFSLKLIRRFTKQMLASLCLLQTKKVIHCDLKPENILLAHPLHSEIKVIDFGSSCLEHEKVYTYIQSRFYRSPEVILGMNYGMPIDMWSLGCILAELLTGYPIFPGENEQEQLACIMEVFGPPEKHLIERASRRKLFFDSLGKPRVTVSSKGKRRRPSSKTLQQALKCDDDAFIDFLSRCLRWDPERRMKPDEAATHEFVTGMKKAPRTRQTRGIPERASSPSKKVAASAAATGPTPGRARVLPDPPTIGQPRNAAPEFLSISPTKNGSAAGARRHSTMQGVPSTSKRLSSGPMAGSTSLPRVNNAGRSFSGKPDLASAAAIASLRAGQP